MSYRSSIEKRNEKILKMREEGVSFKDIGLKLGLSENRVFVIHKEVQYLKNKNYYDFYLAILEAANILEQPVSSASRAFHCLIRKGVMEDIAKNEMFLSDFSDRYLLSIRDMGPILLKLLRLADDIYKRNLGV